MSTVTRYVSRYCTLCKANAKVNCVAWNPKDKEVLVTGSSDGTAKLWNFMESDAKYHALQLVKKPSSISHKSIDTGKKAVTALVWHPDGTVFATGWFLLRT